MAKSIIQKLDSLNLVVKNLPSEENTNWEPFKELMHENSLQSREYLT